MLRKTNSQKGFTIIEVVITIAIGAAVMALVLNAVAGARRSQRNNARSADVNALAAGVNQYIATRNSLPASVGQIVSTTGIVDPAKFGHYVAANINTNLIWNNAIPVTGQVFVWHADYVTAPAGGITGANNDMADSEDYVIVLATAACDGNSTLPVQGGIREMAIVYKLEGQATTICLEV